ncbi:phosphotransferase family protein [Cylindrospermum sp. FACHB-282]|uniref:phosphotransferase family protein n=1 Tax=Cylindrospermum sp. FACHB-282 TaxID=2692794 RepID=UPI001684AE30|nr:phosphotransferase [Cylindrospermum sp. FACHB-282]MBD2385181.1 phosphotransferase [Cylindrospermum sp. FACHB-282]
MRFILSDQNVFDYLISQGLSTPQEKSLSNIELKSGKNFNLLISLPNDRLLLIKQESLNPEGKIQGELFAEWQVRDFLRQFPEVRHLRSCFSEAIHFDAENSIIVFKYLNDYRDLADFHDTENLFPTEIAREVGTTLASIHRLTLDRQDYREFFQNSQNGLSQKPPNLTRGLDRITPAVFGSVPADGLKFFTLYQRYDNLGKAIADLGTAFTPCCLTHNDLKLNNILLSLNWEAAVYQESGERMIRLIDWERGAWGDPANDLGALIASYLQIWLYSIVASKAIAIQDSLRLAATPLNLLQPSIATLVEAYLADFPEILERRPDFLQLVVQFSGLALIRSIQAKLQHEKTFGNSGICILQVAKSLLCRPEASIYTVFGMEASDLIPTNLSPAYTNFS